MSTRNTTRPKHAQRTRRGKPGGGVAVTIPYVRAQKTAKAGITDADKALLNKLEKKYGRAA